MGKGIIITEAGQGAPFRKLPNGDAEMIGVFEPNTQIDLESYDDGWYATTFEGEQGFVAGKFVQALEGIEGLDGKKVKAGKKIAKATKTTKTKSKAKANPSVSESMVKTNSGEEKSLTNKIKKKMSKAEKAKLYEANKIISIERTDKGLSITLEGTNGFDGLAGFDDENLMNGIADKMKKATKNFVAKIKPEVTKITSRGVYEANKTITIRRTDNGFQVGIQGINGFDGVDGLDDEETLNGLISNIKNVFQKVAAGAQKVADTSNNISQTAENIKNTSANAIETTASLKVNAANALDAAKSSAAAAEKLRAAGVLDENNNISPTAKKVVIGAGIALGATLIGLIALRIVKNKKPAPIAAAAPTAPLNGVKKRRKKASKISLE